jgi:hypothetical protein
MRKRENLEPASCQSQPVFSAVLLSWLCQVASEAEKRHRFRVTQHEPDVLARRPLVCCFVPSTRKNKPVEVSVGRWLDAALPERAEVVVSPPHARAAKPMEGVSSVSRLSAGAPQVGRVITLPGTEAYWTVRLLLTGRANVFANLDSGRTAYSQLLALAS